MFRFCSRGECSRAGALLGSYHDPARNVVRALYATSLLVEVGKRCAATPPPTPCPSPIIYSGTAPAVVLSYVLCYASECLYPSDREETAHTVGTAAQSYFHYELLGFRNWSALLKTSQRILSIRNTKHFFFVI